MIKVSVARLAKEPVDLEGEEPADLLEIPESEEFRVTSPVKYRLHCRMVSGSVLVSGCISTAVAGICGRCLEPVAQTVELPDLKLFFDDVGEDELDLTEDVRSEIILALPVNLLCSDDCKGLCPHCGVNRNLQTCSCGQTPAPSGPSPWDALLSFCEKRK